MAPTDLQTQMQCPDYVYDDIGNLLSFMFHEIHFDNKNLITYGHFSDMLSIYPMKDLARETCKNDKANYNEVLLSGSTYASGVFVFKRFLRILRMSCLHYAIHKDCHLLFMMIQRILLSAYQLDLLSVMLN